MFARAGPRALRGSVFVALMGLIVKPARRVKPRGRVLFGRVSFWFSVVGEGQGVVDSWIQRLANVCQPAGGIVILLKRGFLRTLVPSRGVL